jgi:hypothetical protein
MNTAAAPFFFGRIGARRRGLSRRQSSLNGRAADRHSRLRLGGLAGRDQQQIGVLRAATERFPDEVGRDMLSK